MRIEGCRDEEYIDSEVLVPLDFGGFEKLMEEERRPAFCWRKKISHFQTGMESNVGGKFCLLRVTHLGIYSGQNKVF